MIDIIYCGVGNVKLDIISIQNGFKYGLRLPAKNNLDTPLFFSDQDWKNPNKEKYFEFVKLYNPTMATVLDIEREDQFLECLEWAEVISQWVEKIILIPKCLGVIEKIPKYINGKKIILGYSVPTKYGATTLDINLFKDFDIHLLGGAPNKQLEYKEKMNVVSIDCNYHSMKANKFGEYWTGKFNDTRWWRKFEGEINPAQRSLKAFELSCKNIIKRWN